MGDSSDSPERVSVRGLGRLPAFSHASVAGDLIFVSGTLGTRGEAFELVAGKKDCGISFVGFCRSCGHGPLTDCVIITNDKCPIGNDGRQSGWCPKDLLHVTEESDVV